MSLNDVTLQYVPHPTPLRFHQDLYRKVRALCGPFGSGKSVACIEELLFIAMRQEPDAHKRRNVRFGVIRATYPNLKSSTKKTWEKWFPAQWGYVTEGAPMTGRYTIPLPDDTVIKMEVLMIAAEDEEDAKKLRSTDFTAIWINEATEVSEDILGAAVERVGRFPTAHDGDCTQANVLLDYNKPPRGHWLYDVFNNLDEDSIFAYYEQPPAVFKIEGEDGVIRYVVNREAENLAILGGKNGIDGGVIYYQDQVSTKLKAGKTDEIDQLLCMKEVDDKSGKPVWGHIFSRDRHVSKHIIEPMDGEDVIIGIDTSGIHPYACFAQFQGRRWAIIDELLAEEAGFEEFVLSGIVPLIQTKYANCGNFLSVCDPANARDSLRATRPTETLLEAGIPSKVAPTNDPKARIEAVIKLLNMDVGGVIISPNCELLITSCAGGYKYPKRKIAGTIDVIYGTKPLKDKHSHPADGFQYFALHALRSNIMSGVDRSAVKEALKKRIRAGRMA